MKAILVIEMPKNCLECPFRYKSEEMPLGNFSYQSLFRCKREPEGLCEDDGDTVYRLIPKTYRHIEPLKIRKFVICENGLCFTTEKTNFHYSCEEFGEFIFSTKEEAEQALADMKGV